MDIGSILKEIKVSPTRFIQRAHTKELLNIKRQSKTKTKKSEHMGGMEKLWIGFESCSCYGVLIVWVYKQDHFSVFKFDFFFVSNPFLLIVLKLKLLACITWDQARKQQDKTTLAIEILRLYLFRSPDML